MNIVLLGAPGSGKGTLGAQLSQEYGIPHISSGDIIRAQIASKTAFGLQVKDLIAEGKLLADTHEQMGRLFQLIEERLSRYDCRNGYVLDGVPRTLWQAEWLHRSLASRLNVAVLLETSDEVVVERLRNRVICSACKKVYASAPKQCDSCSSIYFDVREDDAPAVVKERLQIYHQNIQPVISFYEQNKVLVHVNGNRDRKEVLALAKKQLFHIGYLLDRIPFYQPKHIKFYNLVEMYKDAMLVRHITNSFSERIGWLKPDYIAAPEARALPIFGALMYQNNLPGIFIRKAGKLPEGAQKLSAAYQTAYSTDTLEMNYADLRDKTVVLVDDGISSGGTTLAMIHLLQSAGARVVGIFAVVRYTYRDPEPAFLAWREKTHTLFELR